jgi:dTDP-4-amino-4,6-dideoxygalactose transaminase
MINLFEPSPDFNSIKLIKDIFKKKYFFKSTYCNSFLIEFSKFQNLKKKNLVLAASCSDLIFNILFTYKKIIKKKFVIVPSNSFQAVPSAVIRAGLNLKIIDIEKNTGNISLEALKKIDRSKIGCIFLTHYGGIPVNIQSLKKIVGKKTLIFEDCAGALGSFYKKKLCVGSFGDFSCWSFDPMKLISCGEGGIAYIRNSKILNSFRENISLGLKNSKSSGFQIAKKKTKWWEYQLMDYGTRSVFTEIDAAIGLPQLKKINLFLNKRKKIRTIYNFNLKNNNNIKIINNINGVKFSNYFFTIFAKKRNQLAKFLYKNKVYSSLRYFSLNKVKIFKNYCSFSDFKNSNFFSQNALNLPIHQNLKTAEIKKICKLINFFYKKSHLL